MPNFKNVQVMTQRHIQNQSLLSRFKHWALGSTALVVGSTAMAAEGDPVIPDFLGPAKTALSGMGTDLGLLFLGVIGILLVILAFSVSRSGIKQARS